MQDIFLFLPRLLKDLSCTGASLQHSLPPQCVQTPHMFLADLALRTQCYMRGHSGWIGFGTHFEERRPDRHSQSLKRAVFSGDEQKPNLMREATIQNLSTLGPYRTRMTTSRPFTGARHDCNTVLSLVNDESFPGCTGDWGNS